MDSLTELTEWALAHGVQLNGITVHRFPGKGLGIVGERTIKVCRARLSVHSWSAILIVMPSLLSTDQFFASCDRLLQFISPKRF
jgi:hypothetical protein